VVYRQQDARRGSHALAAAEAEKHGKQVSDEDGNCHACNPGRLHTPGGSEPLRENHRQPSLAAVAQKREQRRRLLARAQDIRRAGIARARAVRIG
jgi:hypothetical protein